MGDSGAKDNSIPGIDVVHMIQRNPLKYRDEDLSKFVLAAIIPEVDYDYFYCPDDSWWSNGLDGKENFSESFRLFESPEAVLKSLTEGLRTLAETLYLKVYAIEIVGGEIVFNLDTTITRASKE